jgi:glycosyltransferase involved in cell wall biosynthesis
LFNAKNWKWSPYGIDVPEVTRQSQGPEKPCRVLFVGSLQEGKGVLEVLKTASILKAKGKNYVFNLVGPWFSEAFEQEAKALANQLGIEDIVKFPGQLIGEDKWKSYADADVFFFPTHYASEAFPIVLIEALGSGLPIVSTRWRGVPSLVEESGVATLCDPQCPEMFVDALEQWHIRAGDARQISFRARSYYNKLYLPKHFLGRIEDELQRLTGSIRDRSTKPFSYETCSENSNPEVTDLRVLQVFNQYAEQGGEEVWVDQVTSLSDERLRVHELRFHSRAWKMQGAPSPFTQARRMWDNPESRRRLSREVKTLKPDALLFHNLIPVGSFGLYDEARKLGVPVIQYIHNFRPFSPSGTLWHGNRVRDEALHGNPWPEVLGRAWERSLPKTALLAFYLRRLQSSGWLDAVDRWIAICDFMRGKFIEAGIPEHKITTLRHCWTPTVAEPLGQDQGYYLFLGRLVPEKGVGTLLKAWQKLELKLGRACPRLVVAGTGPEETKVMGAAAQGEAIEYAGFVSGEAKQRLLAGCRAVLAPSIWWEPLGLVVYEAYDHGKPVIAARSGGLMETVREGDGGSLHSPGDPDSLVEAILQLEETGHAGRVAMGTAGRKWLLQKADPEAWRKSFAGIVEAVRR